MCVLDELGVCHAQIPTLGHWKRCARLIICSVVFLWTLYDANLFLLTYWQVFVVIASDLAESILWHLSFPLIFDVAHAVFVLSFFVSWRISQHGLILKWSYALQRIRLIWAPFGSVFNESINGLLNFNLLFRITSLL